MMIQQGIKCANEPRSRRGGPVTPAGKRRSAMNALKHGRATQQAIANRRVWNASIRIGQWFVRWLDTAYFWRQHPHGNRDKRYRDAIMQLAKNARQLLRHGDPDGLGEALLDEIEAIHSPADLVWHVSLAERLMAGLLRAMAQGPVTTRLKAATVSINMYMLRDYLIFPLSPPAGGLPWKR